MKLPEHFFCGDIGDLYDTRLPNWYETPVRPLYRRHHAEIQTVAQLKATLRAGRYTSLGCYPLFFITADGAALSFQSARDNFREIASAIKSDDRRSGWRVISCQVNWEDENLYCEHSGERIESAHGESDVTS